MLRVLPQGIGKCTATLLGCVESGSVKIFSIARACAVLCGLWISIGGALAAAPPLFVLNSLEANVSVIDPVTWTETASIPTGKEPHHLYLTPDEKSIIVANALGDTLTFLDPRTAQIQRTVRGIVDPYHLRFSPDMKWFVTAGNRLHHVDIYRWNGDNLELAKRIATDTGFEVANAALQIHGGYGYLADYGVEKIVRDLRVHQILEGTNDILRTIVARKLIEAS